VSAPRDRVVIGIDAGTGSVRAGCFTLDGTLVGRAEHPIEIWHAPDAHVEQSSDDIWAAAGKATRAALGAAGAGTGHVAGIGFDATCSLAAIDAHGGPVTVSRTGDDGRNVVVWMDHRAVEDARAIDGSGHPVLQFVGGSISPEMETPKLRWLRRNLPESWQRTAHWFDLADFLTWRATGATDRSLCTTACKWTYLAHERRWDPSYFEAVGLEDLARDGFARIGTVLRVPGECVGTVTEAAARDLGVAPGTPVASGLIDAHAGALGMIGAAGDHTPLDRRLAVIAGTSACHLALSRERCDVAGVWGPYADVVVPGMWCTEAGISASGAFLDHALAMHPARDALGADPFAALDAVLDRIAPAGDATRLTADRHWQPAVLGNRAPLADPELTGAMAGVRLRDDVEDLACWYLAALQALAYASRHIVDALHDAGRRIDLLVACGGTAANARWLQAHADALGVPVATPEEPDAVLLGAAMLGARAAGAYPSLTDAMTAMTRLGAVVRPDPAQAAYHDAKYRVYRRMLDDSLAYRTTMHEHL
jgi:FGGY-family pentulose kinase